MYEDAREDAQEDSGIEQKIHQRQKRAAFGIYLSGALIGAGGVWISEGLLIGLITSILAMVSLSVFHRHLPDITESNRWGVASNGE